MTNDPLLYSAASTAPTSSLAAFMLFGSTLVCTTSLFTKSFLSGDDRIIRAIFKPNNQGRSSTLDLSSFLSIYTFLHHFSILGLILFLAYICENHPPFAHSDKFYDRDHFFFLLVIIFVVSCYTVQRNDELKHKKSLTSLNYQNGGSAKKKTLGDKLHSIAEKSFNSENDGDDNNDNEHDFQRSTRSTTYSNELYTINTSNQKSYASSRFSTIGGNETFIQAQDTTPENDVLNREQTEEWKGWMQLIFLLYHYYHAEETYNAIRIMITCYLWMTGFGNFSFFYVKNDYSIIRVLHMLWRLNFLVVFLCLTQGTTYILYYICPLHTYYFFIVFFTMKIYKQWNYTKYGLRIKLLLVAFMIYIIWDIDSSLFQMLHFPFLTATPHLGAPSGSMWEWYFRTTLDHWSTLLGMVFAANFPITSLFFRKLEALPKYKCWIGKSSIAFTLCTVFVLWFLGPYQQPKLIYNTMNAYFGFIPLVTFIFLRNLTPTLRSYSLGFLEEVGKITLETYLMQHHIWLTSNAKSLLTLIPGYPKVNMLVVTIMYFYVSRKLYKLTLILRGMLLPEKDIKKCIRYLLALAGSVLLFYCIALFLKSMHFTSLFIIGLVSVVCGLLLYKIITESTWKNHCESLKNEVKDAGFDDDFSFVQSVFQAGKQLDTSYGGKGIGQNSSITRITPPIIGSMALLICGLFWHGMATSGAGKNSTLLHAKCDAFVNNGKWIPIDGCNDESRGLAYRNHDITNFATCNPSGGGTFMWGWQNTHSATHCRFHQRTKQEILETLEYRRVVFIGDSMTRNLFHSFCRQMGLKEAGQYDTSLPKHADIFKTIDTVGVDFKWAPLAMDQLSILKEINTKRKIEKEEEEEKEGSSSVSSYDTVVIGGGAWDRLYLFANDEDQESHRNTVSSLAKEIDFSQSLGVPVTWFVPTTINTAALNTPEKRDHMTESHMDEIKKVYIDQGVLSSSTFVIDGPSFTSDRVHESFDGVHYPNEIYDAGSQIYANALDWLLPKIQELDTKSTNEQKPSPQHQPGSMSNPFLGLMMLCFCFIGLFFFDGFLGFSYVACIFIKGVFPSDLYEEAFYTLHQNMKLPPINISSSSSVWTSMFSTAGTATVATTTTKQEQQPGLKQNTSTMNLEEELAALLGDSKEVELAKKSFGLNIM